MATSITLRAMRADTLERLLRDPRNHGLTPAEIRALPALRTWPRAAIDQAIRDLQALGRHPAAPRKQAA